jgi:hypothetical protein
LRFYERGHSYPEPSEKARASYKHYRLAGCGKGRICHPEPASFADEGSAVRKKTKEKADSSPRSKTERGSE